MKNSDISNNIEAVKIKTDRAAYVFLPQLGILVNSELEHEFADSLPLTDRVDERKFIENLRKELSDEDIEDRLSTMRSITLNISSDCSFRCKYCAYSGNYELNRKHENKSMNIETAKKLIDHLIFWIKNKRRKAKTKTVNIGFYGGEALLELTLLKDIIAYTNKRFLEPGITDTYEIKYGLSTNGYLLNEDIIALLVKHNIRLSISLDGPQEEHDKFRLTQDGKNTWSIIWDNLKRLKSAQPDYYAENVNFLVTLHPFHDYSRMDRFFFENSDFFNMDNVNAYPVNIRLLKEYLINKWFKSETNQVSKLSLKNSIPRLDTKLILQDLHYDIKFTDMCFPGRDKLFADTDGTFHICEKIKPDLPIGDSDNGIDFDAVRRVHRLWNEEIIRNRCWECAAWTFCSVCAALSEEKDGVRIDCSYKNNVKNILSQYIEFKEEEDIKTSNNFNMKTANVVDYIRQL